MLIHIPFYGASDDTIGILSIIIIVIQLVFLIGSIFQTEKSLKNNFNEDGTKRWQQQYHKPEENKLECFEGVGVKSCVLFVYINSVNVIQINDSAL